MMFLKFFTTIPKKFFDGVLREVDYTNLAQSIPYESKKISFIKKTLMRLYGLNVISVIILFIFGFFIISKDNNFLDYFLPPFTYSSFVTLGLITFVMILSFVLIRFYEKTNFKSVWIFIIFSIIAMFFSIIQIILSGFITVIRTW